MPGTELSFDDVIDVLFAGGPEQKAILQRASQNLMRKEEDALLSAILAHLSGSEGRFPGNGPITRFVMSNCEVIARESFRDAIGSAIRLRPLRPLRGFATARGLPLPELRPL